jgi:hypothetical protein
MSLKHPLSLNERYIVCDVIWAVVINVDASAIIVIQPIELTTNSSITNFQVN